MTADPDDNSAALRASAEEDMVRALLDRVLSTGAATEKFSGWVLAGAGGFIGVLFSVSSTVAPHAPKLMLTAILVSVVSLFIGAIVRLMAYNIDHALVMQGIDKQGEEIRGRYQTLMIEQGHYLQSIGKLVPPWRGLDMERVTRNTTALVDLKQRWLPNVIFEAADTIVGWIVPKPIPKGAVDEPFEDLDRPVRLATGAQYWAVVQLLVLIVAVAVGAVAYYVAVLP
jgi:membrane protein YdbS with pleckstrin-like domain